MIRMWRAWKQTAIASQDGPVAVNEGDIVAIVVVPKWSEAFKRLSDILGETVGTDRSIGRER